MMYDCALLVRGHRLGHRKILHCSALPQVTACMSVLYHGVRHSQGGLGRRGRPAAVEMVRPPTAAAAALARVQQAVGGTLQGVGGALHGLGLGNALQNLGAGGALQGLGAGRGAGGSSASPSLRGSGSGLKAIPEDIP